ncbi:MAG: protein-L-isoaspartate(D-aspartate) O-methyltransferase [bacterium]
MVKINSDNNYREKRFQLVQSLRRKGISDEALLSVLEELPRELFVEPAFINRAYDDTALPIRCMQTISQPFTVAYMTQLLEIEPGNKILEIGTGSGYQAAILYLMGARVYSIERIPELLNNAKYLFDKLNFDIKCFEGDGTVGLNQFAPFDGIIVTAAAPSVPQQLVQQLKTGGKLVVPIGEKNLQTMNLIIKADKNNYKIIERDTFKFVPLIGIDGWSELVE